jgi:thiol:disulfide interchange protein DsbA
MRKILLALFLLLPTFAFAAAVPIVEGKDYVVVPAQADNASAKTPAVIEFFSYGCPWCYKMEAPFREWLQTMGKDIQVERIPVVFKTNWDLYAKAFYAAKALALTDKLSPLLFKAIQDDKLPLSSNQDMIDFFAKNGVDKDIASSAFEHSVSIDMEVEAGMTKMAFYQISAVPSFIVNYKYKTDLRMAGSQERLFEVLTYLVKK